MVIAITPGETWEWIHESDRDLPAEDQTVWGCRVLTSRQNGWVENHYAGSSSSKKKGGRRQQEDRPDVEFRAGDYRRAAIVAGLEYVRNFKDADGVEIPMETRRLTIGGETLEVPTDKFLDRVPAEVLVDLAGAITDGPGLRETDRKN